MEYIIDLGGRKRKATEVECTNCKIKFMKRISFINANGNNFCTTTCSSIYKRNRVLLICGHCGIAFERPKSDLNNSKSGNYFCSRVCKDKAQSYMLEIQPNHYKQKSYRNKAFALLGEKCAICGYNKNASALEVHHKDKDRNNNDISNLEVLCCNCHRIHHFS